MLPHVSSLLFNLLQASVAQNIRLFNNYCKSSRPQSNSFSFCCKSTISFSGAGIPFFCIFSHFSLEAFDSISKAFNWVTSFYFSASFTFFSAQSFNFLANISGSSFLFFGDTSSSCRVLLFLSFTVSSSSVFLSMRSILYLFKAWLQEDSNS